MTRIEEEKVTYPGVDEPREDHVDNVNMNVTTEQTDDDEHGTEAIGAAGGAIIGAAVAGPPGALVGGAIGAAGGAIAGEAAEGDDETGAAAGGAAGTVAGAAIGGAIAGPPGALVGGAVGAGAGAGMGDKTEESLEDETLDTDPDRSYTR